mmetsp:Transcript_9874/g.24614  ORF Transcript_9874/g.24614 Transcript_9874/m.24614 type:complete len:268 (+) Transcript_9874:284-1087(+)
MKKETSARCRRRPRPCKQLIMTKIVSAITTIGITTCYCFHSSLLPTSCYTHALLVPPTRLATSTPSLSRTQFSVLGNKGWNSITLTDQHKIQYNQCGSSLFMAPQTPQPRKPRRMLKKRTLKEGDGRRRKRSRRNRHDESSSIGSILPGIVSPNKNKANTNGDKMTQEYRPMVASIRRDTGEDYWIDPKDLEREQRRKEDLEKQRAAFLEGKGEQAMPEEKLMTEVKAPYRQNWIGYFSLMVAILSVIVSQFPELLEPAPTIRFPDL